MLIVEWMILEMRLRSVVVVTSSGGRCSVVVGSGGGRIQI